MSRDAAILYCPKVTIAISTFGDLQQWLPLVKRATDSALAQTVRAEVAVIHAATLHEARNDAAKQADTPWLIFLDADDTLDRHYVEKMLEADGDVIQPATLGIHADGSEDKVPIVIPQVNIKERNYLVIGSMVRRDLFFEVGGFRDLPCLEDWDLWLRCWLAGAEIGCAPEAIYRVTVNHDSRNTDVKRHGDTYARIRSRYDQQERRERQRTDPI